MDFNTASMLESETVISQSSSQNIISVIVRFARQGTSINRHVTNDYNQVLIPIQEIQADDDGSVSKPMHRTHILRNPGWQKGTR